MYFGSHHGKRFALSDSKEACPLLGEEACPSLELVTAVCTLHFFFVFFMHIFLVIFLFCFQLFKFLNFSKYIFTYTIYIYIFLFLFSRNFKISEIYKLINLSFFEKLQKIKKKDKLFFKYKIQQGKREFRKRKQNYEEQ